MATGLIDIIKRSALAAVENSQMCDLRYGKVVSTNPLRVQVTNQLTIPSSMLVVPEHLTDHTVSVNMTWETESNGGHQHSYDETTKNTSWNGDHLHTISGQKTMTIYNALKVGDKVALLRKQGGQSYFILDRI